MSDVAAVSAIRDPDPGKVSGSAWACLGLSVQWRSQVSLHTLPHVTSVSAPSDPPLLSSFLCSTVSSGLNSLAAVTLKDLVLVFKPDLTEKQATWTSKILALIYGAVSIGIAAIARYLGSGILSVRAVEF